MSTPPSDPAAPERGGPAQRRVVVLGSTGSIGVQALAVVAAAPERFRVTALAAGGSDPALLARQALATGAEHVAVADEAALPALREHLAAAARAAGRTGWSPEVDAGADAVVRTAALPADVVLNGITGSVGLAPSLAALEAAAPGGAAEGAVLALANKESLVVGGPLVLSAAERAGGMARAVVPVDSEHSAIAQCLRGGRADEVRRLVLTASGGPFRGRTRAQLEGVTPEQALAHPNFAMGRVITTNSATLVNKGLEVVEAHLLFGVPMSRVDVVVHPQQVVHSMVEFVDGATLAQASPPSMLIPVALGLGWPDRVPDAGPGCDWTRAQSWDFEPLDDDAFPAVRLAREVGAAGGTAPAVYNAANEECVEAFLAGRARFTSIVDTVARVVDDAASAPDASAGVPDGRLALDDVLAAERWARARAHELLGTATSAGAGR
ncbi:1-deoxy-D-xylulose-5-phosphate reductoisomerase [Pseudokineococcus basanitobsidens]|uniref:1-deoxy-D-xylulose 5-phosphate reductoisomerase n=1 Tax=Pseudokineococcus basanitobsidens TaxID=1926649 RepID=A0ABU8RJS7_9ACTN